MAGIQGVIERWLDIPARHQLKAAGSMLLAWAALAFLTYPLGLHCDDFWEALVAREISWPELLTFQGIPAPLHLAVWKLLLPLTDTPPSGPVRVVAAGVHILNAVFVYAALLHLFPPRRMRIALALLFLIYRGGNAALFWAPTLKDVLMTAFVLIAFRIWTEGAVIRKWAALPAALAMMCKPTAVVLGPVLFLYVIWIDSGKPFGGKFRENLAPLALIALVTGTLTLNAVLNPGIYGDHSKGLTMPAVGSVFLYIASQMGNYAVWSLLPVTRYYAIFSDAWIAATAACILLTLPVLFWFFDRRVQFGLAWFICFTLLPVYANGGSPAPHYGYSAAPGLLIAGGTLWTLVTARLPKATIPLGLLSLAWAGVSLWHWPLDREFFAATGKVGTDTYLQMKQHEEEILRAGGFIRYGDKLPLPPLLVPEPKAAEFVYRHPIPVAVERDCPENNVQPCISYLSDPKRSLDCRNTPAGGCVTYIPVGEQSPETTRGP